MAKFFMADDGELFPAGEYLRLETDTNVVVIPEADWRRLVQEWGFLRGRIVGSHDAMVAEGGLRIDDFIKRTEEANDA